MTTILANGTVGLNEHLVLALARARARGEAGYQIAARAEAHPSELSKWMNGRRTPSPAQAARLAAALNCTVADIFPNEVEPGQQNPGSTETSPGGQAQRDQAY